MQKLRERKQLAHKAKLKAKPNPVELEIDQFKNTKDPRTNGRYRQLKHARKRQDAEHAEREAKKSNETQTDTGSDMASPQRYSRGDDHRGRNHYQTLEKVKPKGKRRRPSPIAVKAHNSAVQPGKGKKATLLAASAINLSEIEDTDVWLGNQMPRPGSTVYH
ncbi:MAG: hypothetical protein JO004_10915 [Methylobacteriaceae bacterium]|nr:hypothetical protein [Methylobacteriaceae bacterium]